MITSGIKLSDSLLRIRESIMKDAELIDDKDNIHCHITSAAATLVANAIGEEVIALKKIGE